MIYFYYANQCNIKYSEIQNRQKHASQYAYYDKIEGIDD